MDHQEESVNGIIFSPDRKKILLIKRRDVPVWVLPGGGIDLGETPEKAALRECEEETGYSVSLVRKIAEYTPLCKLARFTHFYECQIEAGKATLTGETQGVAFFPLDALPPLPPPYPDWIADACLFQKELIQKKITSVTYGNLIKHFFTHPILVFRFLLARLGLPINDK
ncbi:MAG: NUDIX hydrolase [Chlamydiia bacterium]|nr:NUDIX hydrolase [Chlamydiia bacterium]